MLKQHSWPGNIRELKNTIERAVISSIGEKLKIEIISVETPDNYHNNTFSAKLAIDKYLTYDEFKNLEKENIIAALKHANWKTWGDEGAAALLGIKPSTLAYQIKTFEIKISNDK